MSPGACHQYTNDQVSEAAMFVGSDVSCKLDFMTIMLLGCDAVWEMQCVADFSVDISSICQKIVQNII